MSEEKTNADVAALPFEAAMKELTDNTFDPEVWLIS